jgi:tRNA nucleotidyltransferase (CCA-adding enzyme)
MKAYLVGGAVRDQLLNFPVKERDWVVVGETPEQMLDKGFKTVGKDFPVFLHPETHEEYALARTERKTAPGYKGFVVHADPDITLEQDLIRRDLTINAIAMLPDGQLIDPYAGQADIQAKLLRHISSAFSEDPVRVLRVARFVARYSHLGFSIAPETMKLMREMVDNGEIDSLVPERVWAETHKALAEQTPQAYFAALKDCGALACVFPEIQQLFGVPQPERYHPEIDTGVHCLLSLEQAVLLTPSPLVRFAVLTHDLGKGITPKEKWPSHRGHEKAGLPLLKSLSKRLRVPNHFAKLAAHVMEYHTHCHRIFELRPATIVDFLAAIGAFKPENSLSGFVLACEADARGRTGLEKNNYPQAHFCLAAQQVGFSVDTSEILERDLQGPEIGQAIRELRIKAVKSLRETVAY